MTAPLLATAPLLSPVMPRFMPASTTFFAGWLARFCRMTRITLTPAHGSGFAGPRAGSRYAAHPRESGGPGPDIADSEIVALDSRVRGNERNVVRDKPGHDAETRCLTFVMPGHSRPKDGVLCTPMCRASTS